MKLPRISAGIFLLMGAAVGVLAADAPRMQPPQASQGRPGPWDNNVLVYQDNGLGAVQPLAVFERAGVPTVARLADGRLMAAFQHFPRDDERNFDRVAVRFSLDEGRAWSEAEPIEVEGMEAGLARPFDPTLVPLPDGRIRLYFTSNRNADFRLSTPAIYSALSDDGIHYRFEPGVRFAVDGRIVIDCAVALHDGAFHLIAPDNGAAQEFFAGRQRHAPPPAGRGYHGVSRDGLTFERLADVSLAVPNRWLGNMQSEGGRLVFFGTGPGPWPVTSVEGHAWRPSDSSITAPGADPGAVKLRSGGWLIAATSPPRPGTASAMRQRRRVAPSGMGAYSE